MLGHADLGKWTEVARSIETGEDLDETMVQEYGTSIQTLKEKLDQIQNKLAQGNLASGLELNRKLKEDLFEDLEQLRTGIAKMNEVAGHIREMSG